MQNVQVEVSPDKILTITVDLKKRLRPSGSGKTILVGTTAGNVSIGDSKDGVKMGLNVYVPTPEQD